VTFKKLLHAETEIGNSSGKYIYSFQPNDTNFSAHSDFSK